MVHPAGGNANWAAARKPVFNAPAVVVILIAVLAFIHAALALAGTNWQVWFLYAFAFIPSRLVQPVFPVLPGSGLWSFLTYAFLHGSWLHLLFNCVWLLVFGTPTARYFGGARFLLLAAVAAIGGALASLALHWGETVIMIGASGAVSGLLGASVPIIYARPTGVGGRRPAALHELLTDRKALIFMVVFFIITILSGASGWTGNSFMEEGGIAWEAHIGGFVFGLATFYLLAPRRVSRR